MPSETRQLGLPPARASLPSSFRNVGMLISPPPFFLKRKEGNIVCFFTGSFRGGLVVKEKKLFWLLSADRQRRLLISTCQKCNLNLALLALKFQFYRHFNSSGLFSTIFPTKFMLKKKYIRFNWI